MPDHKVRTLVYGVMGQFFLDVVWHVFFFNPPVEIDDDQLRAGCFEGLNILLDLRLFVQVSGQLVDAGQPYFYAF